MSAIDFEGLRQGRRHDFAEAIDLLTDHRLGRSIEDTLDETFYRTCPPELRTLELSGDALARARAWVAKRSAPYEHTGFECGAL